MAKSPNIDDIPNLRKIVEEKGVGSTKVMAFVAQEAPAEADEIELAMNKRLDSDPGHAADGLLVLTSDMTDEQIDERLLMLRNRAREQAKALGANL